MNLTKQKSDTIEANIKRILGASAVTVIESTNKDISGLTVTTPAGVINIARSQYGGEIDVACTVPRKEYTVAFKAFGADIVKAFDTENERDEFAETLPDEQKNGAVKAEREAAF